MLAALGVRVRGQLIAQKTEGDEQRSHELDNLATEAENDPLGYLGALHKTQLSPQDKWKLPALRKAIDDATRTLTRRQQSAIRRFKETRASAERVPFKLLGLEFAVNGFWAWTVWLLFLAAGVFYLWLSRRALIRRCRAVWQPPQGATQTGGNLPLWVRPLPRSEPWVACLSQGIRSDAAMEPLGVLCVALLVVALGLAVAVVRMALVSTSLLWAGGSIGFEPLVHAVLLTLLAGFIVGLGLTWSSVPEAGRRSKNREGSVEVMGRRAWLLTAVGGSAVAALYLIGPLNRLVRYSLLRNPRFRQFPTTPHHKRRPKQNPISLSPGFYWGPKRKVYYVPQQGTARSLAGVVREDLEVYQGPFDARVVGTVHPAALVPFVRAGVKQLLHGVTHKATFEEKAQTDRLPKTQRRYREAFELTRAAIRHDEKLRREGKLPNLQLYDLLGAIALNGEDKELLSDAKQMLAAAQVRFPGSPGLSAATAISPPPKGRPRLSASQHSRHSRRKQKGSWLQRRVARLKKFQKERIGGWFEDRIRPYVANYVHVIRERKKRQRKSLFDNMARRAG